MAERLYGDRVSLGTVRVHVEGEATMTGTTAGNPLDSFDDPPRSPLSEAPAMADVEAELQRIARRRLAPAPGTDVASSSHRITRSRRPSVVGGFDSPEGFAFGSDEANRRT
jgi:hypothetical protein